MRNHTVRVQIENNMTDNLQVTINRFTVFYIEQFISKNNLSKEDGIKVLKELIEKQKAKEQKPL